MRTALVLACLGLAATACTHEADSIGAMAISPSLYTDQSCESLSAQMSTEEAHLDTLSRAQDDEIVADVRAFGASLGSMKQQGTRDNEASIAYSKGKINAIDIAMRRKACPMPG